MNFKVISADKDDIPEIIKINQEVYTQMTQKDWYVIDCVSEEFLTHILQGNGFLLKVVDDAARIVGFGFAETKLKTDSELVQILDLNDTLSFCGEIDNIAILPSCRGFSLQRRLLTNLEQLFLAHTSIEMLYVTVHPENIYSLKNCLANGYQEITKTFMYGGKSRFILGKKIR